MNDIVIHTIRRVSVSAVFLAMSVICVIWLVRHWKHVLRFPAVCICLLSAGNATYSCIRAVLWWMRDSGRVDVLTLISAVSWLDAIGEAAVGICMIAILASLFGVAFRKTASNT